MNIWQVSAPVELVRQMEAMRAAQVLGDGGDGLADDDTVLAVLVGYWRQFRHYFVL